MKKAKVLFFDIETSHSIAATFDIFNISIPYGQILKEWRILCAAYKWQGEDNTQTLRSYTTDDRELVERLLDLVSEADILVYHNGDAFDLKKLKARAIVHGLPPLGQVRSIDTYKIAKKEFKFTSNRLDYLANLLGVGSKTQTGQALWLDALNCDQEAIDKMSEYCANDVVILEKIYDKMAPWYRGHPDFAAITGQYDDLACPVCYAAPMHRWDKRIKNKIRYQRYRCNHCGHLKFGERANG